VCQALDSFLHHVSLSLGRSLDGESDALAASRTSQFRQVSCL